MFDVTSSSPEAGSCFSPLAWRYCAKQYFSSFLVSCL
nr:MAG TPA: hypothetical protein [Caudoviricetes sp.]DAV79784.1 MAG TPA: hypothetical protein [Caudoviricetes sp.]DAY47734.1 MAG TPA: hypothetical protein [Caudoviricetes sp.]